MAKGPGHRPLIVLRWVFLVLLVVSAAAVVVIYLGRSGETGPPRLADDQRSLGDLREDDVVLSAEGFEYEAIEEGERMFLIRARRMVSDREQRFALEGVRLSFAGEGGHYEVESNWAVYDLESKNARLNGAVRLAGPDGLELRGEGFDVKQRGRILVSTAKPAVFELPNGYRGTAEVVRINMHHNNLLLTGNVAIYSEPGAEPPVRWRAGRMLYTEADGLLRSEGGVRLERGEDRFASRRLTATFDTEEEGRGGAVRFVQANWDVAARLAPAGGNPGAAVELDARRLGVAFDESEELRSVVLEGPDGGAARVALDDGAGLRQTLTSRRIFAGFTGGSVTRLETQEPAVLEERLARPDARPLRRLCGDSLAARFGDDGLLTSLRVDGRVDYQDLELAARGTRLAGDPERAIRLTGEPALLLSRRGEVTAPEIVYSRGGGSVRATGGVQTRGVEGSGVELAAGDERVPVMITSAEATWTEEPTEVAFAGSVRAWQGESFLLADRMKTLDNGNRLEAEGAVKTVWKPPPDDPSGRGTIEVNAGALAYQRDARQLNYSTAVRVYEAGRTIRCADLELTVDEERRIDRLLCEGNAVVEDPINGRTVRGTEALYTPADRQVLIAGQPVVLRERDGATIEGRRLNYNLDTGEARMVSEPRAGQQGATDGAIGDQG